MKTLNIIITAFVVIVIASILTLFVAVKIHDKEISKISSKDRETALLESFLVLVAEEGADIHIIQSDEQKIEIEQVVDKTMPPLKYEIKNDTLFVYGGYRAFVYCDGLTEIKGNNSFWIGVANYSCPKLKIDMSGGDLQFNYNNQPVEFDSIDLYARNNSNISFFHLDVKNFNIKAETSRISINGKVDSLHSSQIGVDLKVYAIVKHYKGTLEKSSSINFVNHSPEESSVKRDENCTVRMN